MIHRRCSALNVDRGTREERKKAVLLPFGQVVLRCSFALSSKTDSCPSKGSPIHAARALAHPRWEDFNYEFVDGAVNRFYWFGDGNSVADVNEHADSKPIGRSHVE